MASLRRIPHKNGQAVAVMLGDGLKTRILALKLYLGANVRSVIFDKRKALWGLLMPIGVFRAMYSSNGGTLLPLQLEDVAQSLDEVGRFLIPIGEDYGRELEPFRNLLESRYVITDESGVFEFCNIGKR